MSIIQKAEQFVTKKAKNPAWVGMPAMKVILTGVKLHFANIAEPNQFKGNCNWSCNVLLDEAAQAEVELLLGTFAKEWIAMAVQKGLAKGDPSDEIKFQWKAKKVKGQGNVPVVDEEGNKILKLESWKWKEGADPREPLTCFRENDMGKNVRVPHTEAKWYTGTEAMISGMAAVTYDEDKENWVAKIVPKQIKALKIVTGDNSGGCDFGDEEEGSDFGPAEEAPAGEAPAEAKDW